MDARMATFMVRLNRGNGNDVVVFVLTSCRAKQPTRRCLLARRVEVKFPPYLRLIWGADNNIKGNMGGYADFGGTFACPRG
jgi:hypothetical protein